MTITLTFAHLIYAAVLLVVVVGPFIGVTGFIVVTAAKKVPRNKLPWWVKAVVIAWGVPGLLFDWLINRTWAWFRFRDPPRERLLTQRLQRYRRLSDDDPRLHRAIRGWSWLNLFDPGHW